MDGHTAGVTIMERGGTLIGRGDELELLNQAFARARLRRPATVVIGGDTGIGKSWLVAAFTAQLGTDVVVALGRCLDYEGAGPPFDAFESIIEELPALGAAAVADRRSASANFDRPVGIRRRLAEAGSGGPVVAIVEDLHRADPSTRDLFLALAVDPPAGVLLIGTYRTDGLQWNHPLRHILSELERLPTNVRIELAPFSRAETGALLESRTGTAPKDLELDAIFARAAGNPLYTDHLIGGGAGQRARIPGSLRDLVAARSSHSERRPAKSFMSPPPSETSSIETCSRWCPRPTRPVPRTDRGFEPRSRSSSTPGSSHSTRKPRAMCSATR